MSHQKEISLAPQPFFILDCPLWFSPSLKMEWSNGSCGLKCGTLVKGNRREYIANQKSVNRKWAKIYDLLFLFAYCRKFNSEAIKINRLEITSSTENEFSSACVDSSLLGRRRLAD